MDSRDHHDRLLTAFLAGDLNTADARRWDEHLLDCERCWRAVREDRAGRQAAQVLRKPMTSGLADRVAFAVEVAAAANAGAQRQPRPAASSRQPGSHGRRRRWRLAGAGILAAGLAVSLTITLFPGEHRTGRVPAAVAAVARYAQGLPARGQHAPSGGPAVPVEVGRPVTVAAGGQRIVLRIWRLGGTEAVVAVSGRPFPMPARARGVPGRGMAWSARLGKLGLYCLNGRTSELVAAPVPAAELAALAARLPLADGSAGQQGLADASTARHP
jgi:anti-sigma factor RsiW